MKIENCPFCLLKGIESECEHIHYDEREFVELDGRYESIQCEDNDCDYVIFGKDIKSMTKIHNSVSRSVRESMWTKFDPNDESTYPPNEETQIELTLNDGSLYLDEWVYFDTEDGIGWGFETDICYHRIKAWRNPHTVQGAGMTTNEINCLTCYFNEYPPCNDICDGKDYCTHKHIDCPCPSCDEFSEWAYLPKGYMPSND